MKIIIPLYTICTVQEHVEYCRLKAEDLSVKANIYQTNTVQTVEETKVVIQVVNIDTFSEEEHNAFTIMLRYTEEQ